MPTRLPFDSGLTQEGTERQIARVAGETFAGQAHFAGSGPPKATCRTCKFWDAPRDKEGKIEHGSMNLRYAGSGLLKPQRCNKYTAMMGKPGPTVPHDAGACKFYMPTDQPAQQFKEPSTRA